MVYQIIKPIYIATYLSSPIIRLNLSDYQNVGLLGVRLPSIHCILKVKGIKNIEIRREILFKMSTNEYVFNNIRL